MMNGLPLTVTAVVYVSVCVCGLSGWVCVWVGHHCAHFTHHGFPNQNNIACFMFPGIHKLFSLHLTLNKTAFWRPNELRSIQFVIYITFILISASYTVLYSFKRVSLYPVTSSIHCFYQFIRRIKYNKSSIPTLLNYILLRALLKVDESQTLRYWENRENRENAICGLNQFTFLILGYFRYGATATTVRVETLHHSDSDRLLLHSTDCHGSSVLYFEPSVMPKWWTWMDFSDIKLK